MAFMSQNYPKEIQSIITAIESVIQGKRDKIELALSAFLAKGHLLIDDLPGVGKTTLAKTMAQVLGLRYNRIQFTSDLLPSDILGINYYDTNSAAFVFKKGAIFSQFLLADEINRASPKTQSALLEAMEESQVSVDGATHPLPEPFFVVATKNPFEEVGTFELPSSQLDRFMISFSLGYPDAKAERSILRSNTKVIANLEPLSLEIIQELRLKASNVHLSESLLDYLQDIIRFSRESGLFYSGLSTRAALALSDVSKAYAFIQGRDYVTPEDVKTMLPFVSAHRLHLISHTTHESSSDLILNALHID
jgi:MoxR-like ATPase